MPDGLGVMSSFISIISFMSSLFPDSPGSNSAMRLGIGLNEGAGGNVPEVTVFNANYENIGCGRGNFVDLEVHQTSNQQPLNVELEQPQNDGICLAYATHTWPDGHQYGWVGDWGAFCGADSYETQVVVDDSGITTQCVWLDKDSSAGQGSLGLHLWMPASSPERNKGGTEHPAEWYCRHPAIMQFYDTPDATHYTWPPNTRMGGRDIVDGGDVNNSTGASEDRPGRTRSLEIATELVVNYNAAHSAAKLCDSETSFGPDFVSMTEQLACDMGTDTLWPLCNANITIYCFDAEIKALNDGAEQREVESIYEKEDNSGLTFSTHFTYMTTIIPMPGATTTARVKDNSKQIDVTDEETEQIDVNLAKFTAAGERYPASIPVNT
ncbi:hypothetical protein DL765_008070 [Monosporascus sp. GIB2]|nr:hypothetical protein DL765_008070 [Monosporascus sp. GIB2]